MLSKRIIPCLDIKDGKVVKGVNFDNMAVIAEPVEMAKYYNDNGADELVFYDISASIEKREIFDDMLKNVAKKVFIPLCVGGNIKTMADIARVLGSGADKVSINSGAIANPDIINQGAQKYGNQCIVASVDIRKVNNRYEVFTAGGKIATGMEAITWIKEMEQRGAGEVVVNSIDTDGVRGGFDLALLQQVSDAVEIPIVASGGAGKMADFTALFANPKIDAGLAASIFHSKEVDIPTLKRYLADRGIPVRGGRTDEI